MADDDVTISYGCPNCESRQKETGQFRERTVLRRTSLGKIMQYFRINVPPQEVVERYPVTKEIYDLRPITIQKKTHSPTHFRCPYCGANGKYQLRQWKGTEFFQWSVIHYDGSASLFEIHDCSVCGGKFTDYIVSLKYHDVAVCRCCLAQRGGNRLGGYEGG
jgi:transcription elongation factor Elf1